MGWRAIQDTMPQSTSLDQLSDFAERLWVRMLSQTDPWGRLRGEPSKVRRACVPGLPVDDAKVAAALDELVQAGRLVLFSVGGRWYAELVDFDANQPKDVLGRTGKRFVSRFPDPSQAEETRGTTPRGAARRRAAPAEIESEKEKPTTSSENSAETASFPTADDFRTVYDCWRTERGRTHGRFATMSEARRKKIAARLHDGFSVEELCTAIRAVSLDPWPERPRHDDLTVILRSREQVERFLSFAEEHDASPYPQLLEPA